MRNFIFLAFYFLLLGCKEGAENKKFTQIRITATNYLTGLPVEDVSCIVYEQGDFGGSEIISQSSSVNGLFEYDFIASKNKTYSVESSIDLEKYSPVSFLQYAIISKYQMNEYNFKFVEYAYLNADFVNVNCFDENDIMHYRYYYTANPDIFTYNAYWTSLSKDGCVNNTIEAYQELPAGYYTIEWNVQRTSGYDSGVDTFFIGNNDSLTYLLEY